MGWTELRNRINDKFTDAGIVIAFPQRDVHIDGSVLVDRGVATVE